MSTMSPYTSLGTPRSCSPDKSSRPLALNKARSGPQFEQSKKRHRAKDSAPEPRRCDSGRDLFGLHKRRELSLVRRQLELRRTVLRDNSDRAHDSCRAGARYANWRNDPVKAGFNPPDTTQFKIRAPTVLKKRDVIREQSGRNQVLQVCWTPALMQHHAVSKSSSLQPPRQSACTHPAFVVAATANPWQ
jgi:hypothetical protein